LTLTLAGLQCLFANNGDDYWQNAFGFESDATNLYFIIGKSGGFDLVCGAHGMTANNWYFIQAERDSSNNVRLRINGTQVGSTVSNSRNLNSTNQITIGNRYLSSFGWTRSLAGYINDFRLTIGSNQSTSVPTAAFP